MTADEVKAKLKKAGWELDEGANHSVARSPDGKKKITIPRHKGDLGKGLVSAMQRQTGVKLK